MSNKKVKNIVVNVDSKKLGFLSDDRSDFILPHLNDRDDDSVNRLDNKLSKMRNDIDDSTSDLVKVARTLDWNLDFLNSWVSYGVSNIIVELVTESYKDDDGDWSEFEFRGFSDESMVVDFTPVLVHFEDKFKSKDGKEQEWINPNLLVSSYIPELNITNWRQEWCGLDRSKTSVIIANPLSIPHTIDRGDKYSSTNPFIHYFAPVVRAKLIKNSKLLKRDEAHIDLVCEAMEGFVWSHIRIIENNVVNGYPVSNKCYKESKSFGVSKSLAYIKTQLENNMSELKTRVRDKMIPVMMGEMTIDRFVEGWSSDYDDYLQYSATLNCLKPVMKSFLCFEDSIKNPSIEDRTILERFYRFALDFKQLKDENMRIYHSAKSNLDRVAKMSVSELAKSHRAKIEISTINDVNALLQIKEIEGDDAWLKFNTELKPLSEYRHSDGENEAFNGYIKGLKRFIGDWRRS